MNLNFLSSHDNCEDCYDGKVVSDPPTTTTTTTTITTTTTTINPTTTTTTTGSPGSNGACCYVPAGTSIIVCGEMSESQCAQLPESNFNEGKTCLEVNCEDCGCDWDGSDFVAAYFTFVGAPHVCSFNESFNVPMISDGIRYRIYEFDGTLPCGDQYYIRYQCDKTLPVPTSPEEPQKWQILQIEMPCFQNFSWRRAGESDGTVQGFPTSAYGTCNSPNNWIMTDGLYGRDYCNCCVGK